MGNIIHLAETDSTNRYLNELVGKKKAEEGTIVVTDFQTAGKGQTGNSWESEAGKNLTFSLLLYPTEMDIREQFALSEAISLGLTDTLQVYAEGFSIKWPNDIYWQDKKIAGILIENAIMGRGISHCIVGIGLNMNQEEFISDAPNPVSLKQITGKEFPLYELLLTLRENIFNRYIQLLHQDETLYKDYFKSLYRKTGFHLYEAESEKFEAKIKSVQLSGHLVLEDKAGKERVFAFKEVRFV